MSVCVLNRIMLNNLYVTIHVICFINKSQYVALPPSTHHRLIGNVTLLRGISGCGILLESNLLIESRINEKKCWKRSEKESQEVDTWQVGLFDRTDSFNNYYPSRKDL